jgi:molybdopterin synthase catalytic subunit
MSIVVRLEQASLDPSAELGAMIGQSASDGAVVSFVGVARGTAKDGMEIQKVVLEHHPALSHQSLQEIAVEAGQRFDVSHVRVVHRCGEIAPGEPIVFAAASSAHRRAAFEAVDYLMDRLKTEAVLWKREEGAEGSRWIEPTEADHRERERWG